MIVKETELMKFIKRKIGEHMRGEGGMARSQNLGGVRGSSGGEVEERGGGPCRRGGDMGEVSADKREGGRRSGGGREEVPADDSSVWWF